MAMKCQLCHSNEANIVFTQIVNNEKIVLQICSECAQKKGISIEFEKPSQPHEDDTITHAEKVLQDETFSDEDMAITCESCGLTFKEFKKAGLFGCDRCHIAFGKYVETLLKQIHGTCVYDGKEPESVTEQGKVLREIKRLRQELRQSIEREEYEHAARLRDQIAELEEKDAKHDV